MFFDVGLDGDEILINERCGRIVRIGFGFQPNASASIRSRAEIDHQRFVMRLRLAQRCNQEDPSQWEGIVATHFTALQQMVGRERAPPRRRRPRRGSAGRAAA